MTHEELRSEMMDFLPKYEYAEDHFYEPTYYGCDQIIRRWSVAKAPIANLLMKHPNYNGRYQIVLNETFHRDVDRGGLEAFYRYLDRIINVAKPVKAIVGEPSDREHYRCGWVDGSMDEFIGNTVEVRCLNISSADLRFNRMAFRFSLDHLTLIYENGTTEPDAGQMLPKQKSALLDLVLSGAQYVDDETTERLNKKFPTLKLHRNGKTSRTVRKICVMFGLDKDPEFNDMFTKFADAVNPLDVQRWTIISWHPIDYFTMSFGNSWTSCQSIDKTDRLGVYSGSYHGCYCGGTESYMNDTATFVVYVVDRAFKGEQFELEPKIMRQLFHIRQNGKQIIQGRLYPQDNDTGAKETYDKMRAIVQRVVADCFGFANGWTVKSGTRACCEWIRTNGVHYPDYKHFDTCTVSTLRDYVPEGYITIGARQICPTCGDEFSNEDHIICDACRNDGATCEHCGDRFDPEVDGIVTGDGRYFCCSECAERDGYVYCNNDEEWHHSEDDYVYYCDHYEEYFYDRWGDHVETEDGHIFLDDYAAHQESYIQCEDGEWHPIDNCEKDEDGEWHLKNEEEVA